VPTPHLVDFAAKMDNLLDEAGLSITRGTPHRLRSVQPAAGSAPDWRRLGWRRRGCVRTPDCRVTTSRAAHFAHREPPPSGVAENLQARP